MSRRFTRRCTPPTRLLHVWFVVWEDGNGQLQEAEMRSTEIGMEWISIRLGVPHRDVTAQYLGTSDQLARRHSSC